MPRIPSAADVSSVGAGASRLASVRAEPADFGFALGRGLANLGEGLVQARPFVEELLRKEEQRQQAEASVNVTAHKTSVGLAAEQMIGDWEYDGSSAREAAQKASKSLAAFADEQAKALPPAQRATARQATAGVVAGHGLRVAQRAQNAAVETLLGKTDATLVRLQEQAAREPAAAARYAEEGRTLLLSLRTAGAFSPEQFTARNQAFRRSLYAAVVHRQPAADAVADLEAGIYDEALEDPTFRDHLLTQTRWRLQSETAQGQAAAGVLVENARRGEVAPPVRSARTQRLLAAGEMADAELAVERSRRARETLELVRYAPETAVREAIVGLAPATDAADAQERLKLQEESRVQAEALLRERLDDPAAYVMSQPAVAEAFAAAERDPALLDDAVAARLAAQTVMGLPVEEHRALTRAESAEIVAGLGGLPAAGRAAALRAVARHYGNQSGAVIAMLAESGLSPVEALLLDAGGDPAGWRTLTQLVDRQREGKQVRAPQGNLIAEAADRLIAEGQQATVAASDHGGQPPEDMRLSSEWFRPKRNPLREDESLEGRLHIPKLTGTPREQVDVLTARLGLQLSSPGDTVAEDVLDVLKQLVVYRHTVRDGGLDAMKAFRERVGKVASKEFGRHLDYAFAPVVAKMADETLSSAYLHPWSLSDLELTSAIGAMGAKLREDADQSVGFEIASTLAEVLLPVGKAARGIEFALSAIGLGDAITTSVAQENIGRLLNEAFHRKILVYDSRAVKGAGL